MESQGICLSLSDVSSSMMLSGFICVLSNGTISFLIAEYYCVVYIDTHHNFFTHSSVDGQLFPCHEL